MRQKRCCSAGNERAEGLGGGGECRLRGWLARTAFWAGVALLALVTLVAANAEDEGKADVVLRNDKIYADPARSIKQAIAFSGNTILAVGEMRKWIS
jgi:hypothetical protein